MKLSLPFLNDAPKKNPERTVEIKRGNIIGDKPIGNPSEIISNIEKTEINPNGLGRVGKKNKMIAPTHDCQIFNGFLPNLKNPFFFLFTILLYVFSRC